MICRTSITFWYDQYSRVVFFCPKKTEQNQRKTSIFVEKVNHKMPKSESLCRFFQIYRKKNVNWMQSDAITWSVRTMRNQKDQSLSPQHFKCISIIMIYCCLDCAWCNSFYWAFYLKICLILSVFVSKKWKIFNLSNNSTSIGINAIELTILISFI